MSQKIWEESNAKEWVIPEKIPQKMFVLKRKLINEIGLVITDSSRSKGRKMAVPRGRLSTESNL